jgi:hypothetical protein
VRDGSNQRTRHLDVAKPSRVVERRLIIQRVLDVEIRTFPPTL